ncbi:MAG: SPOR domain-containing protein [Pseudomonadota bacterium]
MAELDYFGADYGADAASPFLDAVRGFGVANWAGVVTSLGLTAALGVWTFDLTMRDVSDVPVIRALEGPMRVAPEDPGGVVAPFQGMALSDITSGGAAAPAPEAIVLAPPPVDLDAPSMGERQAAQVAATVVLEQAPQDDTPGDGTRTSLLVQSLSDLAAPSDAPMTEVTTILSSAVAAEAEITAEPAALVANTPSELAAILDAAPVASGPGLAVSARPDQRPAGPRRISTAAAIAAATSSPTEAPAAAPGQQVASVSVTRDVAPETVAVGTRVVQLGAFDSEQIAREEWERLSGRFGDYMQDKSRMIQKARSGGRDFWRLRAVGFADGSEARRFCSVLLAKNAPCIPVTIR